jgi:putative acetyltransferase
MKIRNETPDDFTAIYQLHRDAFGQEDEARLVDALREGGWMALGLLVEDAGQVVAHIAFSRLEIRADDGAVSALALAPVAVTPARQHEGIGAALIQESLAQCAESGHGIVLVLGDPAYYGRFGFSGELAQPLESEYACEAFMALELRPGALANITGRVIYPRPFTEL